MHASGKPANVRQRRTRKSVATLPTASKSGKHAHRAAQTHIVRSSQTRSQFNVTRLTRRFLSVAGIRGIDAAHAWLVSAVPLPPRLPDCRDVPGLLAAIAVDLERIEALQTRLDVAMAARGLL